jgi:hypothetical protein
MCLEEYAIYNGDTSLLEEFAFLDSRVISI